jgi:hypothetical protein
MVVLEATPRQTTAPVAVAGRLQQALMALPQPAATAVMAQPRQFLEVQSLTQAVVAVGLTLAVRVAQAARAVAAQEAPAQILPAWQEPRILAAAVVEVVALNLLRMVWAAPAVPASSSSSTPYPYRAS